MSMTAVCGPQTYPVGYIPACSETGPRLIVGAWSTGVGDGLGDDRAGDGLAFLVGDGVVPFFGVADGAAFGDGDGDGPSDGDELRLGDGSAPVEAESAGEAGSDGDALDVGGGSAVPSPQDRSCPVTGS